MRGWSLPIHWSEKNAACGREKIGLPRPASGIRDLEASLSSTRLPEKEPEAARGAIRRPVEIEIRVEKFQATIQMKRLAFSARLQLPEP